MYLFGVAHKKEHFDTQVTRIDDVCRAMKRNRTTRHLDGIVMVLELAPNYEENVRMGLLKPNFFMSVAEHYRPRCTKVVCGDQELTIPENPDWMLSLVMGEDYFYPDNRRDEIMRQTIESEQPDIVIVGNGHSDEVKEYFPQAYYIVFEKTGGYTARFSHHGRPHIWHRPDQVITI